MIAEIALVEGNRYGGRINVYAQFREKELVKKIPGARLEVIKDAGHSSNLDQPEAFNRVLLDFLTN